MQEEEEGEGEEEEPPEDSQFQLVVDYLWERPRAPPASRWGRLEPNLRCRAVEMARHRQRQRRHRQPLSYRQPLSHRLR